MREFTGYIDMHTHILPGVDDGSKSMEETMNMIKIALDQGIKTIIATPHYAVGRENTPVEELKSIKGIVEAEARKLDENIRIYLGNEIFYSDSVIEKLNSKKALTIANSNYVLVEFSYNELYRVMYRGLNKLVRSGYIPILAHVERYLDLYKSEHHISEMMELGCYMQMNCNSLIGGRFNSRVTYNKQLFKIGMIHFLGSDCHDNKVRIPNIEKAVEALLKKCKEEMVYQIVYENPLILLQE